MMRNDERGRSIMKELPTGKKLLTDGVNRYIDEHLVPTVLRHLYQDRREIVANDYQYLDGALIQLHDGMLSFNANPAHYIHFYTAKSKIETPHWRDIPDSFNVREYIND